MKKISSFMLAVAMIISMAFMMNFAPLKASAAELNVWDGTTITQPASMKTIDGVYYYEISTAEELAYIAKTGGDWLGYNYILANDITLNSVELTYDANGNLTVNASALNQWTPIDGLNGIFNGNGFSVSGVYINSNSDYVGLFGEFGEEGEIKNLTVKNSYIKGKNKVGGICGYTKANVTNCFFDGAVLGNGYVAGIVGYSVWNSISNCENSGNVWGAGTYVSGIVSGDTSFGPNSISNCYNKGNVISTGNYTAGITAATDANSFSNCTNAGNIVGVNYVGGLVAKMEDVSLNNGANLGNISGENYVGGIAGYSTNRSGATYWDSTITNSYNTGAISGNSYVGGIIGYASYGNAYSNYNFGNVSGTSNVGAIIGFSDSIWGKGNVSGCYYLKNDTTNIALNGFGNADDVDGVVNAKDASFFCVNSDKTLNKNGHTYSSTVPCDATCDTCGYERTVTHTYDNVKYDSDKHWYECDCGEKKADSEASHTGGTATCISKAKCDVCKQFYGDLNTNNHTAATSWTNANDQHYHTCSNGCDAKLDIADCSGGTATCQEKATCKICNQAYGDLDANNHTAATSWTSSNGQHYHTCANGCDAKLDIADCSGGTATCQEKATCAICKQTYGAFAEHNFDETSWGCKNADGHAHVCQTSGCSEHDTVVAHTSSGAATKDVAETCTECGYIISPALGHKLSGGAIAGIAVGSTAVVGVGGFSLIWFVIKKKSWADLIAHFKKK